ncbi:MAG: hypothetical protein GTN65_05725, partial [Armatimonadetes bacterium]|nr:hypothetical protein [Armatimonadota bacterium]NIO96592.1 hypothetical protein [Armatimonadota bacterium]
YLAPVCIVTSFLLFTFVFPAGRYPLSHAQTFLLLLPAALTAAMIMMPQVTVRHIFSPASGEKFIVFGPGYAFYFCFIISYFGWGFFRLGR